VICRRCTAIPSIGCSWHRASPRGCASSPEMQSCTNTRTPRYLPEDVDAYAYRSGYTDEARRKNLRSAAIPGVIASTIWTILVLSAAQ